MELEQEQEKSQKQPNHRRHYHHHRRRRHLIPEPKWVIKILSFQADIIYNFIITLFSPLTLFSAIASESYHRTEAAAVAVEAKVMNFPGRMIRGSILLGRRVVVGIMGVIHVMMILTGVMILAGILGVGLVRIWVEEPVMVKDRVLFDYSELNPKAEFEFGEIRVNDDGIKRSKKELIPIGHSFHVSLELLMPESDYNRHLGVFQLNAELLSANGIVIAKSSQPCILTFRSLPIRLIRTCIMSIPLVLGISAETQKMSVRILNHKEGYPRTKLIRVTLIPRPGTSFIPQIYESKILMKSKLPWTKQFIRNWRWTISVWATLYIYIFLVIFILGCCRPVLFPMIGMVTFTENDHDEEDTSTKELEESEPPDEGEVSELLRKWQERRERKAIVGSSVESDSSTSFASEDTSVVVEEDVTVVASSSATSMSFTREDTSLFGEEGFGDSESDSESESICSDD
ncbi:seipin-1 [Euphorbia lathyris]|uniref:seipin-1 n=1 Tax=Euphorbia lathyris TaxID=212925 RepID=UPI0033138345